MASEFNKTITSIRSKLQTVSEIITSKVCIADYFKLNGYKVVKENSYFVIYGKEA